MQKKNIRTILPLLIVKQGQSLFLRSIFRCKCSCFDLGWLLLNP